MHKPTINNTRRRLLPYGRNARLLECRDLADAQAVQHWLAGQPAEMITELVPGARTLLLRLSAPLPAELADTLINIEPQPAIPRSGEVIIIDVRYDGADLQSISDHLKVSPEALIEHHAGQDWTVAFCGFSPGFGYLAPTERELRVPRRSSPRTRVPAGSLAIADHWSAIYPTESPGGWQLIGSTDVTLFDPTLDPPAALRPGMRVRFRRAG
jgi:KipI family sensor histidine kinase inhibitor